MLWSERYSRLQMECRQRLDPVARRHDGFFLDRLKSKESVFSKVESGQFARPFDEITDLYGATIAVPTMADVESVSVEVLEDFAEISRRTARGNEPREFIYDDLHLVLEVRDSGLLADKTVLALPFELQIKSMLQFAWTKVTHDTIYKGDEISWASDRFAAEAKASLELLDNLFTNVPTTSALHSEKENEDYTNKKTILDLAKERWPRESLPTDLRRTAFTIDEYRHLAAWSLEETLDAVRAPTADALTSAESLTPVQAFLAILCGKLTPAERIAFFEKVRAKGRVVHVTDEMEALAPVLKEVPADLRVEFGLGADR
ncbi:MAG: RelA/SpoT domain-containing protein [Chloroflexi bacterium]|nr:RelA/SpoT domain-containing protein [Chloroflexota bacterium]